MIEVPKAGLRQLQTQAQTLTITPQLRQAIAMLQMSSTEIQDLVAAAVADNPFLEFAEGDGSPAAVSPPAMGGSVGASSSAPDGASTPDIPQTYDYSSAVQYGNGGSFDNDDDFSATQNVAVIGTLRDHLISQINVDFRDPCERLIAVALIDFLDDAGYLPADLALAQMQIGASPEMIDRVIYRLQRLDPSGIFARSLKECLAIQLRDSNRLDAATQIMLSHLDLVAKRENTALARLCGVSGDEINDMVAEIRTLQPRPATAFSSSDAAIVPLTPDVFLYPLAGGGWRVELNSDNLPRVLTNERYYATIRASAGLARPDTVYVREQWQHASWLVKSLQQRAETIIKIASEIVRRQDAFFVHGVQHLRPLVLRDVAEAVEMHESTVSRVTDNKSIATPRGVFSLKYFFGNALSTAGGAGYDITATAVKERIRLLIASETPDAILSDDSLTELLQTEGINIARRTVAKYREALRIPTSSLRKRHKRSKS